MDIIRNRKSGLELIHSSKNHLTTWLSLKRDYSARIPRLPSMMGLICLIVLDLNMVQPPKIMLTEGVVRNFLRFNQVVANVRNCTVIKTWPRATSICRSSITY